MNRSCAPHWIVRLGSASRCPDLVVVLAGSSTPVFDESLTPTDAPYPYLKTGLVTVFPFQRFMDHTFLLWSCANRWHSLSAALSQFARLAEHTDTLSSGVQDVVASAGCCSWPPLQLWARRFARRFLCRNVHHHNAPLNQLAVPSRQNSVTRCLKRSAALPFSAARRFPLSLWSSLLPRPQLSLQAQPVGPWWRRDISQPPPRAHVHLDFNS